MGKRGGLAQSARIDRKQVPVREIEPNGGIPDAPQLILPVIVDIVELDDQAGLGCGLSLYIASRRRQPSRYGNGHDGAGDVRVESGAHQQLKEAGRLISRLE